MLWPRGFSSFTHALISQKSCNRKRYYGERAASRKIFTSCGSFLFFRPLSWGNEVEKSCFPMACAAEGGTCSGARGNTRGRCARPRGAGSSQPSPNNGSPAPSVLVRKAATIEAKLRHRRLPHTNTCSLWVSFWIYATNLRLKARFLLAGARMAFRKKWQSGNET